MGIVKDLREDSSSLSNGMAKGIGVRRSWKWELRMSGSSSTWALFV